LPNFETLRSKIYKKIEKKVILERNFTNGFTFQNFGSVTFQNLKNFEEKKKPPRNVTSEMVRFCVFGSYNLNNLGHFGVLGGLEATHGARKAIFVIVLDGCSFLHLN
jgi:hypothetical protein